MNFKEFSSIIRKSAGNYGDDIAVHGSSAKGIARVDSDIDIAIRVYEKKFGSILRNVFGTPNKGSALERTMLHAQKMGKIQRGEIGLSKLGKQLESQFGYKVDISVIRKGGAFDQGPYIQLLK